jgi:hypothetical protein
MFKQKIEMISKKLLFTISLLSLTLQILLSQDAIPVKTEEDIQFIKRRGYSVETCFRIAEGYIRSNTDQIKAIPYLEYIIELDRYVNPRAFYMLSHSYYYHGKFDRAVKAMNDYLNKETNKHFLKLAKEELETFRNAERVASKPRNVVLVNLGPNINSAYPEINPYISKNENLLVYSSKRSKSYNIYVSKKDFNGSTWLRSKLAGNYVNSYNDEFVAGLSSDGKNLMVHYNHLSGFEDINLSSRYKGLFRELEDPGNKVNSNYREEGACLSEDGQILYFASDRPGGFGGFDLYFAHRLPDGTFGAPTNMGQPINTEFDENYPNLSSGGNRFYFASKGHNSIGGYDIFFSDLNPINSKWSKPENMGYPINNAYDNKTIAFADDPRYAYTSTVDWRTHGDYDIYKVIFLDVGPGMLIVKNKVTVSGSEGINYYNEIDDLEITVYKREEVYGKYTFDKRTNSFVLALAPGTYILEIESDRYKPFRRKININENYYKNNQRLLKIQLEEKE